MSLWELHDGNLNVSGSIDDDTGTVYDANHNIIGHYDFNTHNISDQNGNVIGHYDISTGHVYDPSHNSLGAWGIIPGGDGAHLFGPTLNDLGSVNSQGSIFDSAMNLLGGVKKIW